MGVFPCVAFRHFAHEWNLPFAGNSSVTRRSPSLRPRGWDRENSARPSENIPVVERKQWKLKIYMNQPTRWKHAYHYCVPIRGCMIRRRQPPPKQTKKSHSAIANILVLNEWQNGICTRNCKDITEGRRGTKTSSAGFTRRLSPLKYFMICERSAYSTHTMLLLNSRAESRKLWSGRIIPTSLRKLFKQHSVEFIGATCKWKANNEHKAIRTKSNFRDDGRVRVQ